MTFWGPVRDQDQLLARVNYDGPAEKGDEAMEARASELRRTSGERGPGYGGPADQS